MTETPDQKAARQRYERIEAFLDEDNPEGVRSLIAPEPDEEWVEVAHDAASCGAIRVVAALLDAGVTLESRVTGFTLLEDAASNGHVECVKVLLARRARVENSALRYAAMNGHLEVIKNLVEAGAPIDAANPGYPTALGFARSRGYDAAAKYLVEQGATLEEGPGEPAAVPVRSIGGSYILHHGESDPLQALPRGAGRASLIHEMESAFGEATHVLADPDPSAVTVDLHLVAPLEARPYWTIFTTGMSDHEMTLPYEGSEKRRMELMVRLPAAWDIDGALSGAASNRAASWPLEELRGLARIPRQHDTAFVAGDTIPNGDPPEAFFEATGLCGWLLVHPDLAREMILEPADLFEIHVLMAFPLHEREMQLKLARGLADLLRVLDRNDVPLEINPQRPSVIP